jgi:uncharacterized membrane protein YGL010W
VQRVRPIVKLFADYSAVHVSLGNRVCHVGGIPLIFLGAAGLLDRWSPIAGAAFLGALALLWLFLDLRLGLLALLPTALGFFAGLHLPTLAVGGIFLIGNAVPLAGHLFFEKGGPASLREGAFGTLIAPLWLLNLAAHVI